MPSSAAGAPPRRSPVRLGASPARQWLVLTTRAVEVVARNRLTAAIMLGSPALVITMMAVLFEPGAFTVDPTAVGPPQIVFWMAFSAFFFGLTYGLLQVVTERAVLRRERFAGLSLLAYLASKAALLLPVLVAVDAVLLVVLSRLDRLPPLEAGSYSQLLVTLALTSTAGLAIGLAASAGVTDATQATLALPMICFPQVLFAGAVVPVDQMAGAGAGLSFAMATRWSFEALGRVLLPSLDASASTSAASPYHAAFAGSPVEGWVVLATVVVVALGVCLVALHRRTS
jgi:hypothetical protein